MNRIGGVGGCCGENCLTASGERNINPILACSVGITVGTHCRSFLEATRSQCLTYELIMERQTENKMDKQNEPGIL